MRRWALAIGFASGLLWASDLALAQDEEDEEEEQELEDEEELDGDPELGEVPSRPTTVPGPLTIYGGARLGFGGEAAYDPGASDDLITTFGLHAGADYVIIPNFALGGELRMLSFNTDFNDDFENGRSLLFDFVVRPRGRYVFEGMPLEVYGTLPLGMTIPSINEDWNASGKAGFTLGFGAGANYFMSDKLGFGGELIYMKHWFKVESNVASGTTASDLSVALGQIHFVGNVIYAL